MSRSIRTSRFLSTTGDQSDTLQDLFDYAAGGEVIFDGPTVQVDSLINVASGTRIVGKGDTDAVEVGGDLTQLFVGMGANNITIEDFSATFTGTTTDTGSAPPAGGGNKTTAHSLFISNGNGHTIHNVKAADFITPIRVSSWNGSDFSTLAPSDWDIDGLLTIRPGFGLLADHLSHSDVRNVTGRDIQDSLHGGAPPHAVYFSIHGPARMSGTHVSHVHCDGNPYAAAHQFKWMDQTCSASNLTADGCSALVTLIDTDGLMVSEGHATRCVEPRVNGLIYVETTGAVRLRNLSVELDPDTSAIDANARGATIIGNDVAIDGLHMRWWQPAATANLAFALGSTTFDTSDYRLRNVRAVNFHATPGGTLIDTRRMENLDVQIDYFGFGTAHNLGEDTITNLAFTATELDF